MIETLFVAQRVYHEAEIYVSFWENKTKKCVQGETKNSRPYYLLYVHINWISLVEYMLLVRGIWLISLSQTRKTLDQKQEHSQSAYIPG